MNTTEEQSSLRIVHPEHIKSEKQPFFLSAQVPNEKLNSPHRMILRNTARRNARTMPTEYEGAT